MALAMISDKRPYALPALVVATTLLSAIATAIAEGAEAAKPQPRKETPASERTTNTDPAKERETTILALDDMIAVALKSHPEVSAAQAKVQAAVAELDRVRLEVAQRIVEFQKNRTMLESELKGVDAELEEIQSINRRLPGSIPSETVAKAEAKVETLRAELAGMRSQLPFLLGRTSREPQRGLDLADKREHAESMLLHAEQALELTRKNFMAGHADHYDVYRWSKKVMETERLLDRASVAAIERHRDRMQELLKIAKERLLGRLQDAETDVVSAQYCVAEAELLLAQSK